MCPHQVFLPPAKQMTRFYREERVNKVLARATEQANQILRPLEDLVAYRIIPIYLRTVRAENGIDFYIAECTLGAGNQKNAALSELVAESVSRTRILNI